MKLHNAWVPAVFFVAALGFLILAAVKEGEYGYGWAWWASGISAIGAIVTYLNLRK